MIGGRGKGWRDIMKWYHVLRVNSTQRKMLESIFEDPVRPDVSWSAIESLLNALGVELWEGRGSRVRVHLNGVRAVLHRPHPSPRTGKGALKSNKGALKPMRRFLTAAGKQS